MLDRPSHQAPAHRTHARDDLWRQAPDGATAICRRVMAAVPADPAPDHLVRGLMMALSAACRAIEAHGHPTALPVSEIDRALTRLGAGTLERRDP